MFLLLLSIGLWIYFYLCNQNTITLRIRSISGFLEKADQALYRAKKTERKGLFHIMEHKAGTQSLQTSFQVMMFNYIVKKEEGHD
jgi:GGDEF domain-containing protein